MEPSEITLPSDQEDLIELYIFFDRKAHDIWQEYVEYCENLVSYPRASLIMSIIFAEMAFCEAMMMRIRVHLSEDSMRSIESDYFSTW